MTNYFYKHECVYCGQSFSNKGLLHIHYQNAHPLQAKLYHNLKCNMPDTVICPHCETFNQSRELDPLVKRELAFIKEGAMYVCNVCDCIHPDYDDGEGE